MNAMSTGRFRYGPYSLHYETHGEGRKHIVLLHGLLLDADVNRGLAQSLAQAGYHVVLLDLLGHGQSDQPADPTLYRMDFYGQQVLALMDALGIEQAVLAGLSLGANVGLHVAAAAPQRVRALLLEMPVMERATPAAALMFAPLLVLVQAGRPLLARTASLCRRLPRPTHVIAASLYSIFSMAPEAVAAVLHGILVGPVVPQVAERRAIKAPTLIIGHPGDFLHPFDDADALAQQIPGARLLTAHSIIELRSRPQRLLSEILAFLHKAWAPRLVRSARKRLG